MAFFGLFGRNRTQTKGQTDQQIDSIIGNSASKNPPLNPEFSTFNRLTKGIEDIVTNRSVISNVLDKAAVTGSFFTAINSLDVLPVITNKWQRLQQWRNASAFPEVNFCLREIADDFLHFDENGDFAKLIISDNKDNISKERKEILDNEFKKYMALFNFRKNF